MKVKRIDAPAFAVSASTGEGLEEVLKALRLKAKASLIG